VVFTFDDGFDVGNLNPVEIGAAIDAVREAGGESVISILSSNSWGMADAGIIGGDSFLDESSTGFCCADDPNLKDVDIADPNDEEEKDGGGADSVSLVVVVPFVVVVVVVGAPNNGFADSVSCCLEIAFPKLNPLEDDPNTGAVVTGAGVSVFDSSVVLFPKLKEKEGFDSAGLSVSSLPVFESFDVSIDGAGAKSDGLGCSAGGLDGFSASF
jgi:hypothetical protein